MDRLKTPRLQQSQLIELLSAMTVSKEHQQSITELHEAYKVTLFNKFLCNCINYFVIALFR